MDKISFWMTTFKKYGGRQFASKNNITQSFLSTSNNHLVTAGGIGEINSQIYSNGHFNMSGNSLLDVNDLHFSDDSVQNIAFNCNQTGILNVNYVEPLQETSTPLHLNGRGQGVYVDDFLNISGTMVFPGMVKPLIMKNTFCGAVPIQGYFSSTQTIFTTALPVLVDFDYSHVFLTLEFNNSSNNVFATSYYMKPVSTTTTTTTTTTLFKKIPLSIFVQVLQPLTVNVTFVVHFWVYS